MTAQSGTYALGLASQEIGRLHIGRLGTLELEAGLYACVGSACGPGGLVARIQHRRERAARRVGVRHATIHTYHRCRTHLGLEKDAPEPRPVQFPEEGKILAFTEVSGLHHRYERRAA